MSRKGLVEPGLVVGEGIRVCVSTSVVQCCLVCVLCECTGAREGDEMRQRGGRETDSDGRAVEQPIQRLSSKQCLPGGMKRAAGW